jgi:hypothetical protein
MLRTRVYHSRPMRHSVRVRPLVTLLCAACTLAIPASASGSSPVHVDPSSPVAKEYALPLASARGAAPESGKSGSLFGSGIKHGGKPAPPRTVTTQAPPKAVTETKTYTETYTATAPTTPAATSPPVTSPPVTAAPVTVPPVTAAPVTVPPVTVPDPPTTTAPTPTRTTVSAAPAAYQVLRPGSGSGVLWMVLAGVLVVAVGSAGGLALARRR